MLPKEETMRGFALCVGLMAVATAASACDVCAIYTATQSLEAKPGWSVTLFEQYTRFDTLQLDGSEVPNTAGQYLDSSMTHVILGYQFSDRFGVQLHLPYIDRHYRRAEGNAIETGTVSGLGDCSLVAQFVPYESVGEARAVMIGVMAGLKFPTGDSSRLEEELSETEVEGATESAVHGHDLALGSGSLDGVFGASFFYKKSRFLSTANAQYAWRGVGSYGYRYADGLTFAAGLGGYLVNGHEATLALQLKASGETKGKDTMNGAVMEDTGITEVYLGPELSWLVRGSFSGDVSVDFPVISHNTALQIVPTYRIRLGLTWRF
jgi:hypothetical protein